MFRRGFLKTCLGLVGLGAATRVVAEGIDPRKWWFVDFGYKYWDQPRDDPTSYSVIGAGRALLHMKPDARDGSTPNREIATLLIHIIGSEKNDVWVNINSAIEITAPSGNPTDWYDYALVAECPLDSGKIILHKNRFGFNRELYAIGTKKATTPLQPQVD